MKVVNESHIEFTFIDFKLTELQFRSLVDLLGSRASDGYLDNLYDYLFEYLEEFDEERR